MCRRLNETPYLIPSRVFSGMVIEAEKIMTDKHDDRRWGRVSASLPKYTAWLESSSSSKREVIMPLFEILVVFRLINTWKRSCFNVSSYWFESREVVVVSLLVNRGWSLLLFSPRVLLLFRLNLVVLLELLNWELALRVCMCFVTVLPYCVSHQKLVAVFVL